MSEITPDDVEALLDDDTARSVHDVAVELHPGKVRCSECDRSTGAFKQTRQQTRRAMRTLVDQNKVTSTPDWEFRLARRSDDA